MNTTGLARLYAYNKTHRILKAIASATGVPIPEATHRLVEAALGCEQDENFINQSVAIARSFTVKP